MVKVSILSKFMFWFNAIAIKISIGFFIDIDKITLIFTWKGQGVKIAKTILDKNNMGGINLLNFKTLYRNSNQATRH